MGGLVQRDEAFLVPLSPEQEPRDAPAAHEVLPAEVAGLRDAEPGTRQKQEDGADGVFALVFDGEVVGRKLFRGQGLPVPRGPPPGLRQEGFDLLLVVPFGE